MQKKIKIFDKLTIFDVIKNFNNKINIFYLRKSFFLNILTNFLNFKNIKKLSWNYIDLIGPIIDNHERDKFISDFLEDLEKKSKIENCFYHYLVTHLRLNKIIGFMSLEQFLIFINYCNSNFKDCRIIYYIEKSEFNQTIKKKFQDEKNYFIFYFNPFRSSFKENLKYLIKNFLYLFKKKDFKTHKKKDICVMDAFDMNNPDIFFCDKNFYEKILFITRDKDEFLEKCININYYII